MLENCVEQIASFTAVMSESCWVGQLRLYLYWMTDAGAIESAYDSTNPYHTAVHAADVLQAIHCNISGSTVRLSD